MTCFGTSAGYLTACMKAGRRAAGRTRPLRAARASARPARRCRRRAFGWVYEQLGADVWLFSTSGGTDVCTAFVGGVPDLPVYAGELQARSLGAKVEALDEHGRPLDRRGRRAGRSPSRCPRCRSASGTTRTASGYARATSPTYPGIWRHGDWIEITRRGGVIIFGRSDSTINRGGVRMGTSEIYAAVLPLRAGRRRAGRRRRRAGRRLLACRCSSSLRDGAELDERCATQIRRAHPRPTARRGTCPTRSSRCPRSRAPCTGKMLEVPVKRILMGADPDQVVDRESLANPASLGPFLELAER